MQEITAVTTENVLPSPDAYKKVMFIEEFGGETRIAIIKNGVLEDFYSELKEKKIKKGSIYAARITRVEPALQAVFVDFGEEKHGFLPFSEIHPDFYKKGEYVLPSDQDGLNSAAKASLYIQHNIKKNQPIMVQVVKDMRSGKGAYLSTYLSIPGKYTVLMPNMANSSGVSRKITNNTVRQQLKTMLAQLKIPSEMSVILRTSSADQKILSLKKDVAYAQKLWNSLSATGQKGVLHEEEDLIIRAIRDLYTADVEAIWVQGETAFKRAKMFMKMLMPQHTKRLFLYPKTDLFEYYQANTHIQNLYEEKIGLPSGGSIVINPTEALVAIDVNSGRSIKEKHIEDTAFKTNMEAVKAIAYHLKLRDLGGLIIIDFIDMTESKRPLVEKALKEQCKQDRARIKLGKISNFGLLEMSRQRLRQNFLESHTTMCQTCQGKGRVISKQFFTLHALRTLQKEAALEKNIVAVGSYELIIELLNVYKETLLLLEKTHKITITLQGEVSKQGAFFSIIRPEDSVEEHPAARHKMAHHHKHKFSKHGHKTRSAITSTEITGEALVAAGTSEKEHAPQIMLQESDSSTENMPKETDVTLHQETDLAAESEKKKKKRRRRGKKTAKTLSIAIPESGVSKDNSTEKPQHTTTTESNVDIVRHEDIKNEIVETYHVVTLESTHRAPLELLPSIDHVTVDDDILWGWSSHDMVLDDTHSWSKAEKNMQVEKEHRTEFKAKNIQKTAENRQKTPRKVYKNTQKNTKNITPDHEQSISHLQEPMDVVISAVVPINLSELPVDNIPIIESHTVPNVIKNTSQKNGVRKKRSVQKKHDITEKGVVNITKEIVLTASKDDVKKVKKNAVKKSNTAPVFKELKKTLSQMDALEKEKHPVVKTEADTVNNITQKEKVKKPSRKKNNSPQEELS